MKEGILKKGEGVALRDARSSDIRDYKRWMLGGEWKDFDAPWEYKDMSEDEVVKRFGSLFLKDKTEPRKCAIISTLEDKPIGWVNRYSENEHHALFLLGIDICEDEHLGKGLGTESLTLWINYLFENSDIHKVGLQTYSFNIRMKKLAEKLCFTEEGVDREIVHWDGRWHDRIKYGLLRREWE